MALKPENFRNWSPFRIYRKDDDFFVDWIFLGEERFVHPFHDNTIKSLLRLPFNQLFRRQTPLDFLGEIYEKSKSVAPTGFIYHISRCGSTLVSQMFSALSKNIVISEAAVIDKIIRADVQREKKIVWLRWMINALGQQRFVTEEHFFLKFDSWSVLDLALIEQAFPETRWIFLYRNPVEVIVSNLRNPGMQMIPGAIREIFPQMDLMEVLQFSTEERFARTIAAFFEAALKNSVNPNGKFINYNQLPAAVTNEICKHFGVSFTDQEIEKMLEKSRFNAKKPNTEFVADTAQKRTEADSEVIRFAREIVDPLYEKSENLRLS